MMPPDNLDGFFQLLLALALVGVLALLVAIPFGLWWLFTHVTVTIL